jgi:hypothetical protein
MADALSGNMLLSHLSVRYAPGDRALVKDLFELLGFGVDDTRADVMMVRIDRDDRREEYVNRIAVWEMTAEQARYEAAHRDATSRTDLGRAIEDYLADARREPDRAGHFGIRTRSHEELDQIVDAIEQLAGTELGTRVKVTGWCHPGEAGSHSSRFDQAFVWTDLFAPGLIGPGIVFELQYLTR